MPINVILKSKVMDCVDCFPDSPCRNRKCLLVWVTPYLNLLFQCKPTIQNTFHHLFSNRKITWQFLTTLNNIWIATIQEHRSEYAVGHPSINFDNFRNATIRPLKDLLEVVEVIPALEESRQISEAKVSFRLLFVVFDGISGFIGELRISGDISVCGSL